MKWIYPRDGSDPYEAGTRAPAGLVVIGDSHYDIGDPRFFSRETHRAYMKEHGLSIADDHIPDWNKAAQHRADFYQGKPDPALVPDIIRAIEKLNRRNDVR